jgi:hypothetical protein
LELYDGYPCFTKTNYRFLKYRGKEKEDSLPRLRQNTSVAISAQNALPARPLIYKTAILFDFVKIPAPNRSVIKGISRKTIVDCQLLDFIIKIRFWFTPAIVMIKRTLICGFHRKNACLHPKNRILFSSAA